MASPRAVSVLPGWYQRLGDGVRVPFGVILTVWVERKEALINCDRLLDEQRLSVDARVGCREIPVTYAARKAAGLMPSWNELDGRFWGLSGILKDASEGWSFSMEGRGVSWRTSFSGN